MAVEDFNPYELQAYPTGDSSSQDLLDIPREVEVEEDPILDKLKLVGSTATKSTANHPGNSPDWWSRLRPGYSRWDRAGYDDVN